MNLYTIDFETYYAQEYSLSKMSTEAYIRDRRFEVIGVGVKENDAEIKWYEEWEFRNWVNHIDLSNSAILCHHTQFDGAILSWDYRAAPKAWLDTLSMARAVLGGHARSFSLDALAKYFELGTKGTEVINAKGKRRADFTQEEWLRYGEYCKNDVNLTYYLFQLLMLGGGIDHDLLGGRSFPRVELEVIDQHIRMFTEPVIELDTFLLNAALADTRYLKKQALDKAGVDKRDLMSNLKFAQLLIDLGVDPPMKISATTGRETYAFAKTDAGLQALQEHEDPRVQALVAARLENKSTLMETRLENMLAMAARGPMPVYLKYAGADQTMRSSGGDGQNMQNLTRGSALRNAILAPPGYVWVVVDSSNIEARALDTMAGQEDMIEVYKAADRGEGPDVYCVIAEAVYHRPIVKGVDKNERQHGKIIKLSCGYGVGAAKYREVARQQKVILTEDQAVTDIETYRTKHNKVTDLWKRCNKAIEWMYRGDKCPVDYEGMITTARNALVLPNGLRVKYPNLRRQNDAWVYDSGRMAGINVYGGKVTENIIQTVSRNIIMEQSLAISKKFGWKLSVHDEGVFLVKEEVAKDVLDYALEVFRTPPAWWPQIPLNAEGGMSYSYGMAK